MSVTHRSSVSLFTFFHAKNRLQAEQPASFRDSLIYGYFFFPDFSMESCLLCSSNTVFLHGSYCLLLCYLGLLLVSMIELSRLNHLSLTPQHLSGISL